MRDIAQMAGVSAQTISRYFRDPVSIKKVNRDRIDQVVAETGYKPNPLARSLSANRTNLIAAVVPTMDHSIFSQVITGLSETLEPREYGLLIAINAFSLEREEALIERFLAQRVAGLVLVGQEHTDRARQLLVQSEVPVVELLEIDGPAIDICIGFSSFRACFELTETLLRAGRRKIGFISANVQGNDRTQRRLEGYKAALTQAGLSFDPELLAFGAFNIETGAALFAEMIAAHSDLDGVISNDVLGLGIQLQCKRMDLDVPGRIAITGFDNLEISSVVEPKLTTVSFAGHKMGVLAAEALLDLHKADTTGAKRLDIGYEVLWRGTTPNV